MCITIDTAHLAKTKILSMVLNDKEHLIAYSNDVQNLSNRKNSMIFAVPGDISQKDFYDTTKYADFLEELSAKAQDLYASKGIKSRGSTLNAIESFKLGIYDIKLGKTKDLIDYIANSSGLSISQSLLNFYIEKYPNDTLVMCEFDNDKKSSAQPIMFKYTPFNYDVLYFPMMDAHDGNAPKDKSVDRDHTVIWHHPSSDKNKIFDKNISFDAEVPEELNNKNYIKMKYEHDYPNGDLYIYYKEEDYKPIFKY